MGNTTTLQMLLWAATAVVGWVTFAGFSWDRYRTRRSSERLQNRQRDLECFPHPF